VACVLLIVLWISSYWRQSYICIRMPGFRFIRSLCWRGWTSGVYFSDPSMPLPKPELSFNQVANIPPAPGPGWYWHFSNSKTTTELMWIVPCWFMTLVAAVFMPLSWIPWPNRYTVRTLLIGTTLVAVVLGLAVWAASN